MLCSSVVMAGEQRQKQIDFLFSEYDDAMTNIISLVGQMERGEI